MDILILIGVVIICGLPVVILRRVSHFNSPCPRDSYGYETRGVGGGRAQIFGMDSPESAQSHAEETITRITEVKWN